jgi:hypothetical protein
MSNAAREITLAQRPVGAIKLDDFDVKTVELPPLKDGEVLVKNHWMSVDPYMRLYLGEQDGIHAPLQIGDTLDGGAVGQVIESKSAKLPEGSYVQSPLMGWRDRFVSTDAMLQPIDPNLGPIRNFLGVFGLTGITAYGGTIDVLNPQESETLFVSGAAGAVGSLSVQLAKKRGAKVIGSAGTPEKGQWLTETLGADGFINYKTDNLQEKLTELAPEGIDMFFDNVGGSHLEAAIEAMKVRGRIALCGAIELYDTDNYRAGPANLFAIIEKGVTMTGFNAGLFTEQAGDFIANLAKLAAEGSLISEETVVDGFENATRAFMEMLEGKNIGKMLVRLDGAG